MVAKACYIYSININFELFMVKQCADWFVLLCLLLGIGHYWHDCKICECVEFLGVIVLLGLCLTTNFLSLNNSHH